MGRWTHGSTKHGGPAKLNRLNEFECFLTGESDMRAKLKLHRSLLALLITGISIFALAPAVAGDKPKLILQITVDQLRGDLPTRYYDRLGKGGLRYLLDKGVVYNNAHHAHANTETIVG
jgi:hypothetical protein